MNALVDSPLLPRIEVIPHFKVNETISEGHGHTIRNTLVAVTVTSSNDDHIVGQLVIADPTIEDQLITSSHNRGRRRVHFIKEKNDDRILSSEFFCRKINGLGPIHLVDILIEVGDTTNISRFHLRHTQVNHVTTEIISDLLHDLRLADARRAPEKDGPLRLECSKNSLASLSRSDRQMIRHLRHFLISFQMRETVSLYVLNIANRISDVNLFFHFFQK